MILVSLPSRHVVRDSSKCIYRSAVAVKALDGKHITQIACGPQHSIALDSEGVVYVWGYNGYCRLGLGHQKDTLFPTPVPHVRPSTQMTPRPRLTVSQFTGPNVSSMGRMVVAGPSNSVVVDNQGMYWMAGKVSHLLLYCTRQNLTLPP